jgi:hypothetical protein
MMRQPGSPSFTIIETINNKVVKEKVFIADISKSGRVGYNTTYRKENVFTAKVRSLGYVLAIDTTAPTVSMGKSIEGRWVSTKNNSTLH